MEVEQPGGKPLWYGEISSCNKYSVGDSASEGALWPRLLEPKVDCSRGQHPGFCSQLQLILLGWYTGQRTGILLSSLLKWGDACFADSAELLQRTNQCCRLKCFGNGDILPFSLVFVFFQAFLVSTGGKNNGVKQVRNEMMRVNTAWEFTVLPVLSFHPHEGPPEEVVTPPFDRLGDSTKKK